MTARSATPAAVPAVTSGVTALSSRAAAAGGALGAPLVTQLPPCFALASRFYHPVVVSARGERPGPARHTAISWSAELRPPKLLI